MKKPSKLKARRSYPKRHDVKRPEGAPFPGHSAVAPALPQPSSRRPARSTRQDPRSAPAALAARSTIYRRHHPLAIDNKADRRTLRLLLLPFAIMALVLLLLPSLHQFPTLHDVIAETPQLVITELEAETTVTTTAAETLAVVEAPTPLTERGVPHMPLLPTNVVMAEVGTVPPTDAPALADPALGTTQPLIAARLLNWTEPQRSSAIAAALEPVTPEAAPQFAGASAASMPFADARAASRPATLLAAVAPGPAQPAVDGGRVVLATAMVAPGWLVPIPPPPYETSCPVAYGSAATTTDDGAPESPALSTTFGARLALAAAEQMRHFVIYDDKYRQIARSGGDVPPMYGVCTDVVVRAYRAVGIDLQVLVQASRVGAGDPNIDHRRTETLRRYFTRFGQSLPVTSFGENYQPGDIVTYWRPQNSGSRSHIAVVAAVNGPSGNPMIIHNRGWGPQLEDGLFVDRITGHYRYDGTARPDVPPMAASGPGRSSPAATPIALSPAQSVVPAQASGKSRGL